MSRATRKAFDRVDRNDPTLAVDGLSEFLPPESASDVDPALAVSALREFFTDECTAPAAINGTPLLPTSDARLDTDGLGSYFAGHEDAPAVTGDDRVAPRQDDDVVEVVDVAPEDLSFQSEIQRAAMDFQRFAETFYAFASQCQQHRAAFQTTFR